MKLGFLYTCYNEERAVDYSISELRKHYSENRIYVVSDGGPSYNFLLEKFSNLKVSVEDDTMSCTKSITGQNFLDPIHQENIRKCTFATIRRIKDAIAYCESDYLVMMDPDALIRGQLNIPENVKLLGSRINHHMPKETMRILEKVPGAKVIDCWGATPGIFLTSTCLKAFEFLETNPQVLNDLFNSFYAMFAHDFLIPIMFALIGEEETFNPDIIECNRDFHWKSKSNPLVHQFKEYY